MSEGFWERQAAKQRLANPTPGTVNEGRPLTPKVDRPWWDMNVPTSSVPVSQPEVPQEHDFSKATNLKQRMTCPDCGGNNYWKVTPSTAARCFECGYVDGRQIADINRPIGRTSDGSIGNKTRQTDSGGRVVNNYHGNISTAAEAQGRVS